MISYSIFSKNADYINVLLNKHHSEGSEDDEEERWKVEENQKSIVLDNFTRMAIGFFLFGTVSTFVLAILVSN